MVKQEVVVGQDLQYNSSQPLQRPMFQEYIQATYELLAPTLLFSFLPDAQSPDTTRNISCEGFSEGSLDQCVALWTDEEGVPARSAFHNLNNLKERRELKVRKFNILLL